VVPSSTPLGQATVTVTTAQGTTVSGPVTIANVAPGLASASQNGQGLAAANVVRVNADGTQTVTTLTATPLALGATPVYLSLYGTGFRHAASVTVTIGSQTLAPSYSGAAGAGNPNGAEQVNVLLPANLPSGTLNVTIS